MMKREREEGLPLLVCVVEVKEKEERMTLCFRKRESVGRRKRGRETWKSPSMARYVDFTHLQKTERRQGRHQNPTNFCYKCYCDICNTQNLH